MGRYSRLPGIIDELHTISISNLKKWGYLREGQLERGVITWYLGGIKTGSLAILLNTHFSYMELEYTIDKRIEVKYRVELIRKPSNLGKGFIWYFVCPVTGKLCRKLYQNDSKFLHRSTLVGYYYAKQTYSSHARHLNRIFDGFEAREKMHEKYFKPYYNGKPTKRFIRLLKKVNQSRGYTLEQLLLS